MPVALFSHTPFLGLQKGDFVMDKPANSTDQSELVDPVVVPDVATGPHPSAHAIPPDSGAGEGLLQEALPEIKEAAKKVGGFKNLSDIADQLQQDEET
jgi:hypothetical protein